MSFYGCLLITPGGPETLLVRILCPEPLRTGRGFPVPLLSAGRGPRAKATKTTSRRPCLPQQGPHSGILTHQSPFLFLRSQGFSNLNATGRPRGSRRLSGAAQRAGGRTHPGRPPAARLGRLERLRTGTRHHPGHAPGDHQGNEVVTAGWPSGQQRPRHPGSSSPGEASAKLGPRPERKCPWKPGEGTLGPVFPSPRKAANKPTSLRDRKHLRPVAVLPGGTNLARAQFQEQAGPPGLGRGTGRGAALGGQLGSLVNNGRNVRVSSSLIPSSSVSVSRTHHADVYTHTRVHTKNRTLTRQITLTRACT